MQNKGLVDGARDRVAGHVVHGRAEAARRDDDFGAADRVGTRAAPDTARFASPISRPSTMAAYEQFVRQLSGKYFSSRTNSIRAFDRAVRYGDGRDVEEVMCGRATIMDTWHDSTEFITIQITREGTIEMTKLRACEIRIMEPSPPF